jgi:beta-lactamase class A
MHSSGQAARTWRPLRLRSPIVSFVALALLAGCAAAPPAAAIPPSPAPTALPPTATVAPLRFEPGATIAGVEVGGQTLEQARQTLDEALATVATHPLELRAEQASLTLKPETLAVQIPFDALLAEAEQQAKRSRDVQVPLRLSFDEAAVRAELRPLADALATPAELLVVGSEPLSRSFAYRPARGLDLEAALRQIGERLGQPHKQGRLTLRTAVLPGPPERDLARLEAEVLAMAQEWDGVVGFYLRDLASEQELGLNQHSIFSGASVMKVPIMLGTYVSIPRLSADQRELLDLMIVKSDNMAANTLLANIAGGGGTEDALLGLQSMNAMLRELGLPYTYQSLPYEAGQYLIGVLGLDIYTGPPLDGPAPQTAADPYLRTTPLEMGRLMTLVVECSRGKGLLLQRYPTLLSATRCGEMIERLRRNEDRTRIVAGLPSTTTVAHKSGWVEDMQADVAFVESPGGDYVVSIYVYRTVPGGYLADELATPAIAAFSRLVYSFYNPQPLDE